MPFSILRSKKSPGGQDVSPDARAEARQGCSPALSANSGASTIKKEEERPYGIAEWVSGVDPDIE